MSGEETAGTLATETPETAIETPVGDDGIIDLDAPQEVKDEPKGETKDGEGNEGDKDAGEEARAEERKKLSGAQRAKLREQRLLQENTELQRRLEEATRKTPATDASDAEKPPREEDFNGDWFAYQRALTAYDAGKAVRDEIRKDRETRESSDRETKQAEIARERREAHLERVEAAREVIADFDQVMETMKGVNVRNDVIDEIMSSDKSDLISYHLAKNPNELEALNAMNSRELARAMGRLEATLTRPEAKKQTSAPAPLSRPKGGAAPSNQESILEGWLKKKYG
ncbi:hypothetical protein KUL72_20810 [Bradyrhizobium arachidis]|uniref:hypothetical protein n=1 Tax=Bradyrhizobium arachidis TaxID=858423 RepID=UPI0021612AC7|nr:hypothetical protein [Bradyrhizobium arachidis]UVO33958.1 hypothetical protein KUL72_20810 [Bradyrhizobium arachidis]